MKAGGPPATPVYYLELAGEDDRFSVAEAAVGSREVTLAAPGVATAAAVDPSFAGRLARTRSVLAAVGEAPGTVADLLEALATWPLERSGSVAVRTHDVRGRTGVDAAAVNRRVGRALVERGFTVDLEDPEHVLRILATDDGDRRWFCGWTVVEPVRDYGARRPPERPFRQPGTMRPQLARTLVNLSGVPAGGRLLDPMCGAGATLIEAALVGAVPVGVDLQRHMAEGSRENLAAFAPSGAPIHLLQGSAAALPVRQADAAVFDAPYGRQSPIGHGSAPSLVSATLEELEGVVGRCVAVFDQPLEPLAADTGWTVADRFERRVHGSLTRHVAVLVRPGDAR